MFLRCGRPLRLSYLNASAGVPPFHPLPHPTPPPCQEKARLVSTAGAGRAVLGSSMVLRTRPDSCSQLSLELSFYAGLGWTANWSSDLVGGEVDADHQKRPVSTAVPGVGEAVADALVLDLFHTEPKSL